MPDYCSNNQNQKLENGGISSNLTNSEFLTYFYESTEKWKDFISSHPNDVGITESVAFDRQALESILSNTDIKTLVFYFGIKDDKSLTLHVLGEKGNFSNLSKSSFREDIIEQALSFVDENVYCCPEGRPPRT